MLVYTSPNSQRFCAWRSPPKTHFITVFLCMEERIVCSHYTEAARQRAVINFPVRSFHSSIVSLAILFLCVTALMNLPMVFVTYLWCASTFYDPPGPPLLLFPSSPTVS